MAHPLSATMGCRANGPFDMAQKAGAGFSFLNGVISPYDGENPPNFVVEMRIWP